MEQFVFAVPGTVYIEVDAHDRNAAQKVAESYQGHHIDLLRSPPVASRIAAVAPSCADALTLNTVSGRADWDRS